MKRIPVYNADEVAKLWRQAFLCAIDAYEATQRGEEARSLIVTARGFARQANDKMLGEK